MPDYRSEVGQFLPSSHRSKSVGGVPTEKSLANGWGRRLHPPWTGETVGYLGNVEGKEGTMRPKPASRYAAIAGTILLVSAATCLAPSVATAATDDDAAIRALEGRFAAAFNAKDVDAIMKVYVPAKALSSSTSCRPGNMSEPMPIARTGRDSSGFSRVR